MTVASTRTVSVAHAEALQALYGPTFLKISNGEIVAWTFDGPIPDEALAIELAKQGRINFVRSARQPLLEQSDVIAMRCLKAGKPFPPEWSAYVQALRDHTATPYEPLPAAPAVPEGV